MNSMDGKYIKAAFKGFLILAMLALIFQAITIGVYYYNRRNFAERDHIKNEKERCEKVMKGEEGDLTDYSYCKRFLDWLNINTNFNR